MQRHGLQLTINDKAYDSLPPAPHSRQENPASPSGSSHDNAWTQQPTPQTSTKSHDTDLVNHPDGWFTRLLRHPGASPAFMAPLLSLGIRHIGQLITATGTHMISTIDLTLGNKKVTKHQKQALNRLTLAICGVYPSNAMTRPTEMRTFEPLPIACRVLPSHLSHSQTSRTREGTDDIRRCLSNVRVVAPPQHAPITVIKVKRTSKKSLIASMQTATHRLYDRTTIPIVEGHLEPADVNEHSPPGSLATFWQQRQELTASLCETNEATNHWRAIATNPTCTWESFRTYVCHPPPEGNAIDLPIELLASLYDTQYTITSLKGPLQYKYEGRRRECYMASWSNTVVCKHHLPMITKAYQHKGTAISTIGPQNIRRSPHLSFLTQPSGGEPSPLPELIEVEWEDLPHPTDLLTAQPDVGFSLFVPLFSL